jgi:2-polyprenyl-3-methyl-5-hydroxy-6-metoxy-1,4-benzoquinol methylase
MLKRVLRKRLSSLVQDKIAVTYDNGVLLRSYRLARYIERLPEKHPRVCSKEIDLGRLLMGGEGIYSSASYARISGDLLRPSRPIAESCHADLLRAYQASGEDVFSPGRFEATAYYQNAAKSIELTGNYFAAKEAKDIIRRARKFCLMFDGKPFEKQEAGENAPGLPVVVQRVGRSDCFEILHGHHRLAVAAVKGRPTYECLIQLSEPSVTPLQQMVLDSSWTRGRCELYQPISAPELATWPVVRQCADRLEMMLKRLAAGGIRSGSYLDIGCSYGWFVAQMAKRGFQAAGIDRDAAAVSVGRLAYGLDSSATQITDIIAFLDREKQRHDIVSCFSVLHHFVLGTMRCSAAEFIRKVDAITGRALFLDTGECHETWFSESLAGWDAEFIRNWLKENTSFTHIEILGTDADNIGPYHDQYRRHLFVCSRD